MTSAFDADDLFRRSIFSSILGFGRKVKNTDRSPGDNDFSSKNIAGKAESVKHENESYPVVGINNNTTANEQKYRSKQEIYNEIVCECAQLEKNMTMPVPNSVQVRSVACCTSECMDLTQEPSTPETPDLPIPEASSPTERSTNITIENLVRLIVTVVKESGILDGNGTGNKPEDILKRKRLQNNEAAARYRRRQKELKEEAELELTILTNKNNVLKEEIKRMQAEIDQLKAQVLNRTASHPS